MKFGVGIDQWLFVFLLKKRPFSWFNVRGNLGAFNCAPFIAALSITPVFFLDGWSSSSAYVSIKAQFCLSKSLCGFLGCMRIVAIVVLKN